MSEEQSPEVKAFLEEIAAVCRRHNLVINASGYEELEVWPLEYGAVEGERCERDKQCTWVGKVLYLLVAWRGLC